MNNHNLALPFHQHAARNPGAIALVVDEREHTYGALADRAARIAAWVQGVPAADGMKRIGILSNRSMEGYAALLGACWAGAAYVPVNSRLPADRLSSVLRAAALDALVVDDTGQDMLRLGSLPGVPGAVLHPSGAESLVPLAAPVEVSEAAVAYVLFTSGTTGTPKGVMITAGNVFHFLAAMRDWYSFGPDDRFAQHSELSFDVSVFDMFAAWGAGASVHAVPAAQYLSPAKLIRDHRLTVWFSVPSVISFLRRTHQLAPGSLPSLRVSMFAGDAMPLASAEAWKAAAPGSVLDVHYGPTETTVICTGERAGANVTTERGILSIGKPYAGTLCAIVSPELRFLQEPGAVGELAIAGRQVMAGYFRDAALTARRCPTLVHPVHGEGRWYLSGDLARQDAGGSFHHLGRIDNQVKVLGYRVELDDLDAHLRAVAGTDAVSSVGWPVVDGTAQALVAFVSGTGVPVEDLQAALRSRLPVYMLPRRIVVMETLPLNANGKIDRRALVRMLDAGTVG